LKEEDDYWEKKSEKYTEYNLQKVNHTVDPDLPTIIRSGFSEFRNNRQYLYADKWEEFVDGSLRQKIIIDDGHGKRTL